MVFVYEEHEPAKAWLNLTPNDLEEATEDDHDVTVSLGPAAFGSIAIIAVEPGSVEPGPSFAPRIVEIIDHIRDRWNLELPDVEPAPDVHATG